MLRKVEVYKYQKNENTKYNDLIYDYDAIFHRFGCDCYELEFGIGTYSTAIIEKSDGSLENVHVNLIKFKNPTNLVDYGGRCCEKVD